LAIALKNIFMTTTTSITEILNDLVEINRDRIKGYEKASQDIEKYDADLKLVFSEMADQSRDNVDDLNEKIAKHGGDIDNDSSVSGAIHRAWIDVKALFTGKDRTAILESCEFGEDAIQKAYDSALSSDAEIDADCRQLITKQKSSLKTSHDAIKKYRDINKALSN